MDIESAIFSQHSRKIGTLVPSVVISEKHSDALEITEHPVEIGAPVSDHAFKRPSDVVMELGFAGGGSLLNGINMGAIGLSLGLSPQDTYKQILDLQASRQPFDVITGKKTYSNMLIRAIEVTTDKTSENVLMCVLTLHEVIITQTQLAPVADKSNMTQGVSTSAVQNTGTKALTRPVTVNSLLTSANSFFGGVPADVLSFIGIPLK